MLIANCPDWYNRFLRFITSLPTIIVMSKSHSTLKTFNEVLASVLLFSCVIALVYVLAFVLPSRQPNVNVQDYKYVLSVDSAGALTEEAKGQADSLIAAVKHHERSINEHYDYVLQQKEDTQTLYTVVGAILSVVVAVFGFFGYKNYKSIEEKAFAMVGDKVEEKMKEVFKEQETTLKSLREDCLDETEKEVKKQFVEFKNKTLDDVISRRLKDEYTSKIDSQLNEIDGLKQRLAGLENNVQLLAACYYDMDNKYRKVVKSEIVSTPSTELANSKTESVVDMVNNYGKDNKKG